MPVTDYLERNAREFGSDIALVEVNPEQRGVKRGTWKEYELTEATNAPH